MSNHDLHSKPIADRMRENDNAVIRGAADSSSLREHQLTQNMMKQSNDPALQEAARRHAMSQQSPGYQIDVDAWAALFETKEGALSMIIGGTLGVVISVAVILNLNGVDLGVGGLYQKASDWLLKPQSAIVACEKGATVRQDFVYWGEEITFSKACNAEKIWVQKCFNPSRPSTVESKSTVTGVTFKITASQHSCEITQAPVSGLKTPAP